MSAKKLHWAAPGDVNAFFGLMLDNIADLLLMVGLLTVAFGFPTKFALTHMVPGTAIGVLVGDLLFFWMALRLARRTGRKDVTAMPLGLDTPSTFGMVFFVLGPAFQDAMAYPDAILGQATISPWDAARHAWHIGIWAIVLSGLFKFACAFGSNLVRKLVPRAGLLGSLTAIALVLISFLPLLDVFHYPVVGFMALAIILTALVARIRLPARVPGTLGALVVAGLIYYLMYATGTLGHEPPSPGFAPHEALFPRDWLSAFRFEWVWDFQYAVKYLPIVIPFALATVVGGIDCVESAAAAGDEFDTNQVIGVEAVATLIAGLCGGVIQTTPYIGHPAYKAMGGRAAYTLATALFVGGAGLIGYFGYLYLIIPKATVFPILVFIGLEITAQSFRATPVRHYPAVALACLPALAALVLLFTDNLQGQYHFHAEELHNSISKYQQLADPPPPDSPARAAWDAVEQKGRRLAEMTGDHGVQFGDEPVEPLREQLARNLQTVRILASGFIVTSLIWASALAALIDRRLSLAATWFAVAAACALFGIIHSPLPGSPLVNPFRLPDNLNLPSMAAGQTPFYLALAYLAASALLLAWGWIATDNGSKEPRS
jgi:AGZA family xanthine/uracil permease-like MFS transporter